MTDADLERIEADVKKLLFFEEDIEKLIAEVRRTRGHDRLVAALTKQRDRCDCRWECGCNVCDESRNALAAALANQNGGG